ncbi:MAG: beta-lactamase family protein [Rhodoferax sp.]|nr:beta-lactamase family protein [Rhodoferax sp.]
MTSRIDEILQSQQDPQAPGISILLRKNGVLIYDNGKGVADAAQGAQITSATVFQLASVTKPITAIAVMQLVEAGRLSLDDSVLRWLSGLPASWSAITVRHLLAHRSGVPDYVVNVPVAQIPLLDGLTNEGLLQRFSLDARLDFSPGSAAAYSGSNYVLLAEIIARATGQRYADYLRERIFEPLGMRSTFVSGAAVPANISLALNRATQTTTWGIHLLTMGDMGIFSSVTDLDLLLRAFRAGQLVSAASVQAMTVAQSGEAINKGGEFYGFGWVVPGNISQPTVFAHSGQMDGFRSLVRINQQQDMELVMLSNGGEATLQVMNAVRGAVQQIYE